MRKIDETVKVKKMAPLAFLLHCITGILICIVLSLLFSVLISSEKLPAYAINTVSYISIFMGAWTASVMSAKKFGKTLLTAIAQGLLYFVFLYLLGAVIFSRIKPSDVSLYIPLSCFAGAVFGAIITALFKHRKR